MIDGDWDRTDKPVNTTNDEDDKHIINVDAQWVVLIVMFIMCAIMFSKVLIIADKVDIILDYVKELARSGYL